MKKERIKSILVDELVKYRVDRVLEEYHNALQVWLSKQDGEMAINEAQPEHECSCRDERKEGYQQGLRAALEFIQEYERARKAK